jgi:hypothetical protein
MRDDREGATAGDLGFVGHGRAGFMPQSEGRFK